ncbi:MAG TPA: hypothetical protein VL125_04465 [Pelobium sp.]|nr:hypothetical protein [Pelobium sp.]
MKTIDLQNQSIENLNRFFKRLMLSYPEAHEKELTAEMLVQLMQINLGFCKLNEFAISCLESAVKEAEHFINCPKEVQPTLRCLVKILTPLQIYLVKYQNSTSSNKSHGYDVYIIIPERPGRKLVHLQPYLDLAGLSPKEMSCSVFTWAKVKDGLAKGQLFFLLQFNQKHLVFDDGNLSIPILGLSERLLAKAQMAAVFAPNFKLANAFLKSALLQNDRGELNLAAFMLHQATEFTYRAFPAFFLRCRSKNASYSHFSKPFEASHTYFKCGFQFRYPRG